MHRVWWIEAWFSSLSLSSFKTVCNLVWLVKRSFNSEFFCCSFSSVFFRSWSLHLSFLMATSILRTEKRSKYLNSVQIWLFIFVSQQKNLGSLVSCVCFCLQIISFSKTIILCKSCSLSACSSGACGHPSPTGGSSTEETSHLRTISWRAQHDFLCTRAISLNERD